MLLFWGIVFSFIVLVLLMVCWPLRGKHSYLMLLVAVVLPVFAVTLYHWVGSSQQLQKYYQVTAREQLIKQELIKYHNNPAEIIAKLEQILQQHPTSAKGWYLLGRLYFTSHNYSAASDAFAKAYQLQMHKFNYAFGYLQSIYLAKDQQLTPQSQQLLDTLSAQFKNSPELLNFKAADAFIHNRYASAVKYWEQILPLLPPNSPIQQELLADIAQAQKLLQTGSR